LLLAERLPEEELDADDEELEIEEATPEMSYIMS